MTSAGGEGLNLRLRVRGAAEAAPGKPREGGYSEGGSAGATGMTAIDLVGIVGIEDHPQAGVGIGWLAGHGGDDDHLVGRWGEDGLQPPGNASADAADG